MRIIKMKTGKKILIAITVVVTVFVIVAFIVFRQTDKKIIITTSTLREVVNISELSTGEFCYNGVVSIPKEKNPEKIDYSVKYDSTVKAGIDAEEVDFKIDMENKTITPVIPAIKITDVIIDDGSISTIPENETANLKEVLAYCKEDALEKATQNEKLIETAESNLRDSITALLMPILKESGYEIVWSEGEE